MASKFGGVEASRNQWVMQQNMARHRSAMGLGYTHKPRQPKKPAPAPAAPAAKPLPPQDTAVEKPETSAE